MDLNVTQKIIQSHLLEGKMIPGSEIGLKVDQTLTQDATGTLVMLELEAMGITRVVTELSAQYIDHNLIQEDYKNADDHLFLLSACEKFGIWYSRAGNGVSHPVHMQHFGIPGKILLGSDSHTCAAGSLGMIAIGAGGLEVALCMAGHPFYVKMPKVWGIELEGELPDWVSAKDIILELLRRHTVEGGIGYILEYFGSGLKPLSAMDRHVIANMGAELGATTTVFPSDETTQLFLQNQNRAKDWVLLKADLKAQYDRYDKIDLSTLEPLIALPQSPDKVVKVREVAGQEIYQAYIGSSANPGFRDFAISALMVEGKQVHPRVSYDINPSTRSILEELIAEGHIARMVHAGARLHQAGCNGCIGMGQAPATGRNSLRTVPRNFPGRSGTKEDSVFLCSPETATASALTGVITDPRDLNIPYSKVAPPKTYIVNDAMLLPPKTLEAAKEVTLIKGPNIESLPKLSPIPKKLLLPILLKLEDDISTDGILPAGAKILPYRSNIRKIAQFCFEGIDPSYPKRAEQAKEEFQGHAILAGKNYGQGSSREHAALAPRYLGLQLVIAESFARIHWQNLINFGILPCTLASHFYQLLEKGDLIEIVELDLEVGKPIPIKVVNKDLNKDIHFEVEHQLTQRQIEILEVGGLINWIRSK